MLSIEIEMEHLSVQKILANWLRKNMQREKLRNIDLQRTLQAQGYRATSPYISRLKHQGVSYTKAAEIALLFGWPLPDLTTANIRTDSDSQANIDRRKMQLATAQWLADKQAEAALQPKMLAKMLQRQGLKYTNYDLWNKKGRGMTYEEAQQIAKALGWAIPTERQLLEDEKVTASTSPYW